MTIEEARKKCFDGIKQCDTDFMNDVKEILRHDGMDGDVVRIKDGKKGVFKLNIRLYTLQFYPYTKTGRLALNPSGIVWVEKYLQDFRRCDE